MKKFIVTILLIAVMGGLLLAGCDNGSGYNEELVKTGDFQSENISSYWIGGYTNSSSNKPVISTDNEHVEPEHLNNARLHNDTSDYTYLYQSVAIEKNAIYKLTVDIKLVLSSTASGSGAYVRLKENTTVNLIKVTDAVNVWKTYTVYFKVKDTDTATILLSMGTENYKCLGEARFDNVSLQKVDSVPSGYELMTLREYHENSANTSGGVWYTVILAVITVAITVGVYVYMRRQYAKEAEKGALKPFFNSGVVTLLLLLVTTFVIRLLLALFLFRQDAATLIQAEALLDAGKMNITKIYADSAFSLMAPGEAFMYWLLGGLGDKVLGITTASGMAVLGKAPAILADIVTVYLIYATGKKYSDERTAALMAGLYAVLPVSFTVAAADTTMVSLFVMLTVLTFVCLLEKKHVAMFAFLFFALFLTELAFMLVPFVLAYAIYLMVKKNDKKTVITMSLSMAVSLVMLYVLSLPLTIDFIGAGKPFFVIEKYFELAFKNLVCSDNGYSLYAIFALNTKSVNTAANVLNVIFVIILIVYTLLLYFKNKHRGELILLASMFITGVGVLCLNRDQTSIFLGIALLLVYILISGEKRLYGVMTALVTLSFVNVAQLLNLQGAFGGDAAMYDIGYKNALLIIGSILSVLTVAYYGYLAYNITVDERMEIIRPMFDTPWVAFKKRLKYLMGKENIVE